LRPCPGSCGVEGRRERLGAGGCMNHDNVPQRNAHWPLTSFQLTAIAVCMGSIARGLDILASPFSPRRQGRVGPAEFSASVALLSAGLVVMALARCFWHRAPTLGQAPDLPPSGLIADSECLLSTAARAASRSAGAAGPEQIGIGATIAALRSSCPSTPPTVAQQRPSLPMRRLPFRGRGRSVAPDRRGHSRYGWRSPFAMGCRCRWRCCWSPWRRCRRSLDFLSTRRPPEALQTAPA